MEKKSPGKYVLVFEPKYAYHQFAVYFSSDNRVQITKIKKFTDLSFDKEKTVKKNLLGDIDKKMTSCSDLNEFFKKYIDPSVFSYYGYNLHNMFIAYKSNGKLRTLNYSVNNSKLNTKLNFVEGSKFTDRASISNLINFAVDTDEKNRFLTFINEQKQQHKTGLTDDVCSMLIELRRYKIAKENGYDIGLLFSSLELTDALTEKLTSYKEYRELYLLRQAYIEKLNLEKEMLERAKAKITTPKNNPFTMNEKLPEFDQLNLFGEVVPYQKTRKKQ